MTFDTPPPGAGFATVIEAVLAFARTEPGTAAVTCAGLTNVVDRGVPFQATTDPLTNPAPLTAIVKPAPPGIAEPGTVGESMYGTGLLTAKTAWQAIRTTAKEKLAVVHRLVFNRWRGAANIERL